MKHRIIRVADGFWNIRGSFKVGGVLEVGTHASLVRRSNGNYLLLDSYTLGADVERELRALTGDGQDIEAILNVHPFHTIHVRWMHECFPNARLYGTARHVQRFPQLPWESLRVEDADLHAAFADDLDFEVPRGVDFISRNENVHFSSVLVYHRTTKTIHVDDTLMYIRFPKVAGLLGLPDVLSFHPTLSQALTRRSGASEDFARWARELASAWCDAENLCAAHTSVLTAERNEGASIEKRILEALGKVHPKLEAHRRRYG